MARVHKVAKSVKPHICGRGGHEIPAGEPYLWAKPGFRTRTPLVRCTAICERLGVKPEALLSVRTVADPDPVLVVEYETDLAHPGRRAPGIWRIHIETEG